jgi:hypothetical protein
VGVSFDDRDLATSMGALGAELGAAIDVQSKPQYDVVVEGTPRELTARASDFRLQQEQKMVE